MAIVRRLALSLAILVNLLATTAAGGATCAGAHTPSLSNGTASPASGTTATLFTFSVTFKDSKGCVPNRVWVAVSGVNNFDMTTSGTDFLQGVTYRVSTTLPITGTHSYSFFATSGATVGTTSVTPSSVTVTAVPTPTPVPTPVETPVPTPKPTPIPTPKPTPVPTPVPTTAPTIAPTDAPTPPAEATSVPQSTPGTAPGTTGQGPSPSVAGGGGAPGPAVSPSPGGQVPVPAASSSEGSTPAIVIQTERMDSFALVVSGWATATGGGLALFLLLATRRRREEEPALAVAGEGTAAIEDVAPPPSEPLPQSTLVPPDEVGVPRWLRPSVRAARQGQLGRSQRTEDS